MHETLAVVGAAGGAGATRLAVESAATLARAGRDVTVIDAAFATQGLATYVDGRLDPDLTAVLADEAAFDDAAVTAWPDLDGRVELCPAHAPFERVARAKTPAAAEAFERCVDRAHRRSDAVIVDVPPVAANQAVAAVTTVERRALVAPPDRRGPDLVPRMRGRLGDVGVEADALVANRVDGEPAIDADYEIPVGDRDAVTPTAADPDTAFAPAVATAVEGLFECSLDLSFPTDGFF